MSIQPIHLLNKMGVLISFSVAKKITESYISKYFKKQRKLGKTDEEIQKLFIQKIENEILNSMNDYTIPGLLKEGGQFDNKNTSNLPKDITEKIPSINKLIVFIAHRIMGQKFDKMTLCYIINSLVNLLNLSEEDFEKFHGLDGEGEGEDEIE
jgi:hypothetical protein